MTRKIATRGQKHSKSIAVIGEGITEQYYLLSLKGVIGAQIEPKLPKHSTGMQYLKEEIEKCIAAGYSHVYCLIDMDNKGEGKNKTHYIRLKEKYHNQTVSKPKEGIKCKIIFFENERCLELWFLYHFKYTTALYPTSDVLTKELNTLCGYQKTEKFFLSTKGGLHRLLLKHGGDFDKAKINAAKSLQTKEEDNREYTYSEMSNFFKMLAD
ncbi:RloB family protein [Paludibacter sp.]|uniref:RloB family protein n=1 Tax=Paludibacter sp. TaxID=1898105 RepID=UPI001352412E|nr:RloB family protein [Paludibacter sp.]MTK53202.1 RloB domain-containing protein [Paludibacter sp.]